MAPRVALVDGSIFAYRVPFLSALRERSDRLLVAATRIADSVCESLAAADIDMHVIRNASVKRTWRHPAGFEEPVLFDVPLGIARVLRSYRSSVVVSGDLGLRSAQAAAHCQRHGVPLVLWVRVSEHSEQGRSRPQRLARPKILQLASKIIVNGASGASYVTSLGIDPARVRVVHQALLPPAIATHHNGGPDGEVKLVTIGRLVRSKGLHLFFDAMTEMALGGWHMTVIGDGYYRTPLEEQARELRLPVDFVGYQPPGQLAELLSAAHFLVHPSLSDEWALVVGESLASGVPVLGSVYAQAVTELVRDGVNGMCFNPDDLATVAAAVGWASGTDRGAWEPLSWAARASAAHLYPDTVADAFVEVLAAAALQTG